MEARSLTVSTSATPAGQRVNGCGCGCGCEEPHDVCCGLDCIVAPRYFCGQLLTDQDLDALVQWTRDKARLARYRDGWGVVCGLDVHCRHDRPGTIVVSPGYAVGCCGDDIVICEDAELDLSAACIDDLDPCGELDAPVRPRPVDRPVARGMFGPAPAAPGASPQRAPEPFDVYVTYDEQLADPRAALARAACSEAAACEHARVRESFKLTWKASGTGDPVTAAATAWKAGYDQTLEVLDAFQAAFSSVDKDQAEDVRTWFVRWIDSHPIHHFCSLRDRVCAVDAATLATGAELAGLLFWLVQDRRNAYLVCDCYACGPGSGVPLARVWLQRPQGSANGGCHVAGIDPYWPYRRDISLECWPAPPGSVNLAQLIWHRQTQACVRLADLGVGIDGVTDWDPPEDLGELRRVLECSPFVACGDRRRLVVYDAGPFERRVIGFCETAQAVTPPSLTLTKTSDPKEGPPGTEVNFIFEVANDGAESFRVVVDDDLMGPIGETQVAPGATETFTKLVPIAGQPGPVRNTATAVATNAGAKTTATATHVYQSLAPENAAIDAVIDALSEARPNETVDYKVTVFNTGDVGLRVTAKDEETLNRMPQEARDGFDLAAQTERSFAFTNVVPTDVSEVVEVVHAIGQTAAGTDVDITASHTITVLKVDPVVPDQLLAITGVGEARAKALARAGIHNYQELLEADAEALAAQIPGATTSAAVREWQAAARKLSGR